MLSIDALKAYGADTDDGLTRCMNNEEFYLKMVRKGVAISTLENIEKMLSERNYAMAFELAHGIKGVLANLALTPMLKPISEMTELLRADREKNPAEVDTDYTELLAEAKKQKEALDALVS